MSKLSDYVENRLNNDFGTVEDRSKRALYSNYMSGIGSDSSATEDLANVFGGSAISTFGDILTGLAVHAKETADSYNDPELLDIKRKLNMYGGGGAKGMADGALDAFATPSALKNAQAISDYGRDMVANHTKQGKAPDGKTWGEMGLWDRVSNLDYWTDPYGIGNDVAVLGGSVLGQAPVMAAIPGGTIARGAQVATKGLLSGLGKKAMQKVASPSSGLNFANGTSLYRMGEKLTKAGESLGNSRTLGSMADWAVRSGPATALTNAGGIYSDLKEQGYSDSEIAQAMRNMMAEELPQDFVTGALSGLALSGKLGRIGLGKAGTKASRLRQGIQNFAINAPIEVTSEYFDEANQQRLQNKYTNKEYGADIFHLTDDERAAGATAAAPALIPGLAGGVRNTVLRGRSMKEAYKDFYGNYKRKRADEATRQTIANTNAEISNAVDEANTNNFSFFADEEDNVVVGTPNTPNAPSGGGVIDTTSAVEPFMGQRMDNGENGCVEAVTKIGANGGNSFLADELKNGVVGVPKLVEDAGDKVVPFDKNNVSEGDLIVYGNDDHVVMADGKGGYVGNSSSQNQVIHGDNYMEMDGLEPTKIIKTGGTSRNTSDTASNTGGSYSGDSTIDSLINSAAQKYNLPPALLAALAEQESGFDVNAKSGAGAIGIMQLMPETAEGLGVDPNDVASNIEGGAKYLRQMLDIYDGDIEKALAAYNAGPKAMEDVGNDISKLSGETRNYVPSVLEKYKKFGGEQPVSNENNSNTGTQISQLDVFNRADQYFADNVINDFVETASDDDTYSFPGLENLLKHASEEGAIDRNELVNEGLEQFEQYLNKIMNASDIDVARRAEQMAVGVKNQTEYTRIAEALNSNDTPVIKQVANRYRGKARKILNNIQKVKTKQVEAQQENAPTQTQQITPNNQSVNNPVQAMVERQEQANNSKVKFSEQQYQGSNDIEQRMADVQTQQANMQAQMAQEQAFAMAKASSEKAKRISQAQALKNVAKLNNIEIPKAVQPGLEAGAKKAIETVQALVAPTLESAKGGNVNETQTTSTEKTTSTEGINTENQVQHTESRQGNAETEGEVNSNPEIEIGTHVNTKNGKTQYTAKIKKTLNFKRLKALAKEHNGWYSTYRTVRAFLFNDEADRNAFVDDVNREFFNKEKTDTKADTSSQKQDDTSLYEKYKTAINNIIRQYRHGQITKSEAESKKKALQEQLKADAKAGSFASEPETEVFISKTLIGINQILNEIEINNVNESSNNNSNKENKKATSEGGNADRIRKSLIAMATKAWNDNNVHERVSFPPSQKLKDKVKELFEHDIDEVFITSDDVRHIKKHHSENEEKRGQVSLTADDIADIYDTVNDFDSATLEESDKQGNKKMITVRRDNGKMYSLLIERGTKKVEVKTAYRQKNKTAMFDVTSPKPNVRNDSQFSTSNVTENAEESKPASTDVESHKDGEVNTVKATYSDKTGSMKGSIANGVITVWEKPGGMPKKEKSFTVTLEEVDNALKIGGANSAYTIRQLAKEKERTATEAWIEGSKTESLRDKRRDHWENDTVHGKFPAQEERAIDSAAKVIGNLYEQATGQKPMSRDEKKAEEKENAKAKPSETSRERTGENVKNDDTIRDDIFGEYDEEGMFKVLGITAENAEDTVLSAPDNISNTAKERARLEKELMAELNKLSANPVFNPKIYTLGLQIGFTYIKDGYNTTKKWLAKMHQQFGDNIKPWAPAILKTIQSWPAGEPFDEKVATYITKNVGVLYGSGQYSSLNGIKHYMTRNMSPTQKERFAPIIEASYNGVKTFFENLKEVESNGQEQGKSGSTASGREGLQSGTVEGIEERTGEPNRVSRDIPGQSGREGTENTGSADGENTRGAEPSRERASREQSENDGMGDSERGRKQSSKVKIAKAVINNQPAGNYEIKDRVEGKIKEETRYKQNIEAIKLLKQLESENRMPTPEEQDILAAYNGWGGLKSAFLDEKKNNELKELLTDEEYEAVKATINDAFYTSPDIIRTIWKGISSLGFKGGRVLDPSMGIGNFFGCMPRDMMGKSSLHGVEIDDLTSRFAKKLYPNANIEHKGFQDSKTPNGYYDLVISNIPFGTKKIQGYNIHNFFFANGIAKVRPGGLMVFITSQGTLTNSSDGARMRSYLAEKADMIAAYKLPEGVFKEAGTDVVTDIIVMQKRDEDGKPSPNAQNFVNVSKETAYNGTANINDYFLEHGENVLGTKYVKRTQNGVSVGVKPREGRTAVEELETAMQSLPQNIYTDSNKKKESTFDTVKTVNSVSNAEGTRMFEYYEKDGKIYQNVGEYAEEVTKNTAIVKGILKIKEAMNKLIAAQYNPDMTEKDLDVLRKNLNKIYDTFVKKHGYLHSNAPRMAYKDDPSAGMLLALERPTYESETKKNKAGKNYTVKKLVGVEKADIFSKRIIAAVEEVTKADNPSDALLFSLNNTGGVDLEYMAKLLGSTPAKVVTALKGRIFKNPATGTYETKDEYLSGNVRTKLAVAEIEAVNDKTYEENVEALKKVVPEDLVSDEIMVNMGSPWIPVTDVQEYINKMTRTDGRFKVEYSHAAGKWSVSRSYAQNPKFNAERVDLHTLLENILNNKAIEVSHTDSAGHKIVDKELTDAANVVADDIRADFREWLWSDKEREKRLVRYYNDNYNNSVVREYDGSHLTFPGMNPAIKLDAHQKNVIWRTIQKGNTLIAHCVGAGKTFSMQAAGMEMRRLGIARKPLYCLPNNVVEQFAREFRQLYPNVKILKLTNADLPAVPKSSETKTVRGEETTTDYLKDPAKRDKILSARSERTRTLSRIQTEDWDAIIISHNLFERFPVSPETAAGFVREEIQNVEAAIMEKAGDRFGKRELSRLEDRKANLKEKLKELLNTETKDIGIPFEQLGIDQIFVDEADLFKNLYFATTMDRISGLSNTNAHRSTDMFMKTQWLTNNMGGRGVVFATGTPISNTMAEMFTMMRYMDMQGLKEKGLNLFDRWCATFAEVGSGLERKPTGDGFRKVNKIKRFINMAELTKMFRKFADVKTQEDLNLDIPELKGGKPTVVSLEADPEIVHYIKNVVPERVENMSNGYKAEKGADNMLSLTNDLRKMSLNDSKIEACADMIANKFKETEDVKGAQLVFCDQGIPRADKDKADAGDGKKVGDETLDNTSEEENSAVYTKLKEALIRRGIPANQIAFVQDAKTKPQMDEMFQKVDSGNLRVLIGSTQKMGAGTNCQHHLVALHDLDAPWRPRDLEQRHGRILRRGNENKEVEIFNYVVKDSFDANMWEKLKNKAAIIAQAMSSDTNLRAVEDADLVTLGYAEIEGAATGNPLIKEQLRLNNEVTKYANGQATFKKQQAQAQKDIDEIPAKIERMQSRVKAIEADLKNRVDTKGDKFKAVIGGRTYTERAKANEALQKIVTAYTKRTSNEIGEIGGLKIKAINSEGYTVNGQTAGGGVVLQLVGNHAYEVKTTSIQGLENALKSQPEASLEGLKKQLKDDEGKLENAKEMVNKTYPHAEELKAMQKQLNEINRQIERELVEGGEQQNKENSDETKYSLADNKNGEGITAEQFKSSVRKAFPTATNLKSSGDVVSFDLPNGSKVTVSLVNGIAITDADRTRAAGDYGRNVTSGEIAEGSYHSVGRDGFIELAKGGRMGTIFHEAYHFAKATALNTKEKAFLSKRYKNEEQEAEAYREWRLARNRTGMFGKIWNKILDIANKMADVLGVQTEGNIFRSIESGKAFDRKQDNKTDDNLSEKQEGFSNEEIKKTEKKYSLLTNDNSSEGLITRISRRFASFRSAKGQNDYRKMAQGLLEDLTQAKIRWGRMDKDTAVIFKKTEGVLRSAKPYDWARLMPEVGGIVAERLGLESTDSMKNYIADWVLTGAYNNNSAEAQAFNRAMRNNAYIADKLIETKNLFMEHADKKTHDFHQNMISFSSPKTKDTIGKILDEIYTDFVEELHPLDNMEKAIEGKTGQKIKPSLSPYRAFRMLRGYYGKVTAMLEGDSKYAVEALQEYYPNVDFSNFKPLATILKEAGANHHNKKEYEAFAEYCVKMHVRDIHEFNRKNAETIAMNEDEIERMKQQGKPASEYKPLEKENKKLKEAFMETPYTEEECIETINEVKKNKPQFVQAQKDLVAFSSTSLEILYDSGRISAKRYNNTRDKWPNYVPMFREFDENEELNFGDSMKAQKGSNRKVIDPIQSIIRNTNMFIKQAETNLCRQKVADLARCSGVGEYIELVGDDGHHDLGDTVPVYVNGKRKYLVTDPAVVKCIQRMDRDNSGTMLKLLQIPVAIGRACFVTINPAFAIRNLFRDTADAAVYSKYGFTPLDIAHGFSSTFQEDKRFWRWMVAGGAQSSAISVDRNYTESTVDKLTRTKWEKFTSFNTKDGWLTALRDNGVVRALQTAGEYTEYAVRVGTFAKNLENMQSKEGKTVRDAMICAAFESRDLMDFARGGRYSRTLNKISLFSNAAIQGWDKFFRVFDPRDKKTFMRATARLVLTSMVPALTLALLFRGDTWWEEAPDWLKENNWLMKVGDTIIRIPKGQDIGIRFFSNFIEKGISKTGKMDSELLAPLYDALPSLVPFGLVPIAEVASNHSFFTHGKVVPGYLERLPEDKQYNTQTPSLIRFIGEQIGYSPIKIDHLLAGYFGNAYRAIGEFINFIGRDKKSLPTVTDAPILNGVTYMPYKQPASVTKFYEDWDKIQKEHTLYNQTGKARNGYSESEYKKMSKVNKALTELSKKERAVVEDTHLTSSDRYDKQMAIQKQRMNIVHSLK